MKWTQQFENHPFLENVARQINNLNRQIIIRSIQYRKYYQKEIPPEQILEWINEHPELEKGRLSDSVETLRYQSFYRKLNSFEDSAMAIKWFENKFDSLKIDEINAFLDWFGHQQYFSTMTKAEKMLQKSKDIVFQAIKEEIEQEKKTFFEKYPFFEEPSLDLTEINIAGRGNFATIVEFNSQNTVIKIPNEPSDLFSSEGYLEILQEAENHLAFERAIDRLKRTENNPIPDWLAVPQIRKVPEEMPDSMADMLYMMEKVHGISLKRFAFLTVERLRNKLVPFTESEIRALSEFEFEIFLKKRKMSADEFQTKNDFVPDLFFEAFPAHTYLGKKFQNIKEILASVENREKVWHTDLHSDNILFDEETETVFLIDFGIAITHSSKK